MVSSVKEKEVIQLHLGTEIALQHANMTLEELNQLTITKSTRNKNAKFLRAIAGDLNIKYVGLKKEQLIIEIWKVLQQFKSQEFKTVETGYKDQIVNDVVNNIYKNKNGRTGFNTYLKKCFDEGKTSETYSPEFTDLIVMFRPTLEKHLDVNLNSYKYNTLVDYKREVLIKLKEKLERDFKGYDWKSFYDEYTTRLKSSFFDITSEIRKKSKISLGSRQESLASLSCIDAIAKAREVLTNLRKYQKYAWKDIVCSLMLVTGRRQGEILQSGSFSIVDEYHVEFSGQLKKQGDVKDKPYIIPTLVPAQLVINGMKWLQDFGKRNCKTPREAHKRFSKEVSTSSKQFISQYCKLLTGEWFYVDKNDGKQKDRKVSHLFRHIYGQVCYLLHCNDTEYINHYLTKIYGHNSDETGTSTASQNYLSKVKIKDSKTDLERVVYGS